MSPDDSAQICPMQHIANSAFHLLSLLLFCYYASDLLVYLFHKPIFFDAADVFPAAFRVQPNVFSDVPFSTLFLGDVPTFCTCCGGCVFPPFVAHVAVDFGGIFLEICPFQAQKKHVY